ncbi:MAG: hypothetical protein WCG01_04850 [bacterium]
MPTKEQAVHYHHGPDRLAIMLSLMRGQKGQRNTVNFVIEKPTDIFSIGEHQADVIAVERYALVNSTWIITANILSSETPLVAKGLCSTESWVTSGKWEEYYSSSKTPDIILPESGGLEIYGGPPKINFFASLFMHDNQPDRHAYFSLKENEKARDWECMINHIERGNVPAEWFFEAVVKPTSVNLDEGRYQNAVGHYCTQTRKGKLFFV